ncbi:uncharacterized protein METZ01_LOCUS203694, partial [marine metagenome]
VGHLGELDVQWSAIIPSQGAYHPVGTHQRQQRVSPQTVAGHREHVTFFQRRLESCEHL